MAGLAEPCGVDVLRGACAGLDASSHTGGYVNGARNDLVAGVAALAFTARLLTPLIPQAFPAFTVTLPVVKFAPKLTVMEVLPCPDTIVAVEGTVHK